MIKSYSDFIAMDLANYVIKESTNITTTSKWKSQYQKLENVCKAAHSKLGIDEHPRLLIETAMAESAMGTKTSKVSKSWWQIDPPSYRSAMASPKAFSKYVTRYNKTKLAKTVLTINNSQMKEVLKANGIKPDITNLMEVLRQGGKQIKKQKAAYNRILYWSSFGSGSKKKNSIAFLKKVDLSQYAYSELSKPEVGVLFALHHYYSVLGEAKYVEVTSYGKRDERANIWKKYYNTSAGKGTPQKYLAAAKYYYTMSGIPDGHDTPNKGIVAKSMGFGDSKSMLAVIKKAGVPDNIIKKNLI